MNTQPSERDNNKLWGIYIPLAASYPLSGSLSSNSLPTITAPSTPALEAIVYAGVCINNK